MHHPEGGLPGFYFQVFPARGGAKRVALLPYDFTSAGPLTPSDVELRAYASHVTLQAPTLFTIAQDLTKMQVYAKTDESDVGGMVDAYPRETFTGTVAQVRMNSTVVQNVVTYDTVIDFDNPELNLFPRMEIG
ncbi:MAG: HlyD family secretion protein [Verrucomicrobiota bacterium]|jgi:hypothetical protein